MRASIGWKRVKWGVFLLCGVGALFLAFKAGVSAAPLTQLTARAASPTDRANPDEGRVALRELDAVRLARLETAVRQLSERAEHANVDQSGPAAELELEQSDQRLSLSPEEEMALGEVERATYVEVAKERISSEARDTAWAPQFEGAILRGGQSAFPNLKFKNLNCKTTLCELQVTGATRDEIDKFILNFPQTFPLADQAHYEPLELPDGSFGVELHVVRRGSGHEFEQEVAANAHLTFDRMTL